MHCTHSDQVGQYHDGELAGDQVRVFEQHLSQCTPCAEAVAQLRELEQALGHSPSAPVPASLWDSIEARLDRAPRAPSPLFRILRKPMAAAASVALLIGAGAAVTVLINNSASTARADTIDYSILLDGIAANVDAAVERFFAKYGATAIRPDQVKEAAPALDFALPEILPGGFELQQVYRLQFGRHPGVAARYRRGKEPLVVFFHPPVKNTQYGVHRGSSCHVASGHEGTRVEIGGWDLLHFTDPRTCHCLLSRLSRPEQLEVMRSIAIELANQANP